MKRKNLFLLCGVPGSGKTTWVNKQIETSKLQNKYIEGKIAATHISRDEIRFSIIKDDEDYFSHEDEVFDTFCNKIQEALDNESDDICAVFADATHINERSRNKTLDRLNLENTDVYAVGFDIPVEICLDQNEKRKEMGRAYVPRGVIRRMSTQYASPTDNEKHKYKAILHIGV